MAAKRKLIVTGQKPITTVKTNAGGTSTLYEVYATDEHGEIVEEPLRSFAELEEDICLEYGIERYDHPQYGTSYTLTPPRRNTAKRLREAEELLAQVVHWAERQGFDVREEKKLMASEARQAEADRVEQTAPVEAPESPEMDEKFGETAPWSESDLDESKVEEQSL